MKESNTIITKKDITQLGLRSGLLNIAFNYERMQACGWLWSLLPILKKIHKTDKQELSKSMKMHLEFINTHSILATFLMGLVVSMEEKKEDRTIIQGVKTALFGPLAGIGDAIFWFTILPIVVGVTSSFAIEGSVLGPILFFICYLAIFGLRIPLAHMGYDIGIKGLEHIQENSQKLAKSASILGLTVIGGLVAMYVNIELLWTIPINAEKSISIQNDFFDLIIPKLLPLLYTLLIFYLLKYKQKSPIVLIVGTFIVVTVLAYFGIM